MTVHRIDEARPRRELPPHSLEAEQSVLGAIMLDPAALDTASDVVSESDFYRAAHRVIFATMRTLAEKGQATDVVTLSEALEMSGQLADAGGDSYLGALARDTPSAANVRAYAQIVRDHAIRRGVMAAGARISDLARTDADPAEVLDRAQGFLIGLAEQANPSGPLPVGDALSGFLDDLDARQQRGGGLAGLSTGLVDLDRYTSGLQPGRFYVLAGRPGTGKSMLALQIALRVAIEESAPVMFSTLEMPTAEVLTRACAYLQRIDLGHLTDARLTDDEWTRLTAATTQLRAAALVIDETPAVSILDLRARARRMVRERGLRLLVVDYLQLMTASGENRVQQIGAISRGLKSLAKELGISIIACASLNRGLEQRTDKRPQMSDLRESGDIESDSDVVMMLYRDDLYSEDSPDAGCAELLLRKNRGGPLGRIALRFAGAQSRFDSMISMPSWQ